LIHAQGVLPASFCLLSTGAHAQSAAPWFHLRAPECGSWLRSPDSSGSRTPVQCGPFPELVLRSFRGMVVPLGRGECLLWKAGPSLGLIL